MPSVLEGADGVVTKDTTLEGARYFLDIRNTGTVGYAELTVPGLVEDMQDVLEKNLWLPSGNGDVQGTLDEIAKMANGGG